MARLDAQVSYSPFSLVQAERACDPADDFAFAYVLESEGVLTGFIVLGTGVKEATVLALTVMPNRQGVGLGKQLLQHALTALAALDVERCLLEVRATNATALALYTKCGFTIDGQRAGYYKTATGKEDAILMSRQILGRMQRK